MSKADILAELPKLTPAERQEVRLKLARLDGEEWLDAEDPRSAPMANNSSATTVCWNAR